MIASATGTSTRYVECTPTCRTLTGCTRRRLAADGSMQPRCWGVAWLAARLCVLLLLQDVATHRACFGNATTFVPCTGDPFVSLSMNNTVYVVAPGCYDADMRLDVSPPTTNVSIRLVDALVSIRISSGVVGVHVYLEHTSATAGQAMSNMTKESLLELVDSTSSIAVTLQNVRWGPTNMSLLRPSDTTGSALTTATENTVFTLRNTSVDFTAGRSVPSRRYWIQLPSMVDKVNISLLHCTVVTRWDRPSTSAIGFILIVLDPRGGSDLRIDVESSSLSAEITCPENVCDTTAYGSGAAYFAFVYLDAKLMKSNVLLDRFSFTVANSTMFMVDTPSAYMSLSVVGVRALWIGDRDAGNVTMTHLRCILTDSHANMTGHDSVVWVDLEGLRLVADAFLQIARCSTNQLRRGKGIDRQLSNEACVLKLDRSQLVRSSIVLDDVVGALRTAAGDSDRATLDGSNGASALILHMGNATACSLRILRCSIQLDVVFGYVSLSSTEPVRIFTSCATPVLIDSQTNGIAQGSVLEIADSAFNVSSIFSYSNRIAQLKHFIYVTSLSVVTITLGIAHNHVSMRNVTLSHHGAASPLSTGVHFGSQVVITVTQSGLWTAGSRPGTGTLAVNFNNTVLIEGARVVLDAAAAQRSWDRVPEDVRAVMDRRSELNVFAFSGLQVKGRYVAKDVSATSQHLIVHGVCMLGVEPIPPELAVSISQLSGLDISTQLQSSDIVIDGMRTVNGTALWLLYAKPEDNVSNASITVRGSSFRSPGRGDRGEFSAVVYRALPLQSRPLPRLALHMSRTELYGYTSAVDNDAVSWGNMLTSSGLRKWDDTFRFDCVTINGAALTPLDTGVVRVFLDKTSIDSPCPLQFTRSRSRTASAALPIPPLTRPPRADHGMSPYFTVAAAVTSVAAPGAVILMQRSIAVLSLAECDPSIDTVPEASDSPLQLLLGNATTGGYIRGAVVGNVVFVAAACLLVMGGGAVATRADRVSLGVAAWAMHAARAVGMPGLMLAPLGLLLQPTVAACVTAMGSLGGGGDVAIGIVGIVLCLSPCAFLAWRVTVRQECEAVSARLLERRRQRLKTAAVAMPPNGTAAHEHHDAASKPHKHEALLLRIARYLVAPEVEWIARGRHARLFAAHFGSVYEGYRAQRFWFVCVEIAIGVAFGVLLGVRPQTEAGCRAQLWVNLGLSIVVLLTAALRAYNGLLWNLNYAFNAIAMLGVAVMLLLERDTESGIMAMIMAWVGVSVALGDGVLHSILRGVTKSIRRFLRMLGIRLRGGDDGSDDEERVAMTSRMFPGVTKLVYQSSIGRRSTTRTADTLLDQFICGAQAPRCGGTSPENALRLLIEIIATQRTALPPRGGADTQNQQ